MRDSVPDRTAEAQQRLHRAFADSVDEAIRSPRLTNVRGKIESALQLLASREVDARNLEQRDVLVAHVHVVPRSLDKAIEERCAKHRVFG